MYIQKGVNNLVNEPEPKLKYLLKANIFIALQMCDIFDKPEIAERLCILLVKTEYLNYWQLVDELDCICSEIVS